MKKIIFSAAVLMSFIACKDNAGNTGSSSETQPAVTQPTNTTPATPSSTTALPQGSNSSTAGLNPPHGQPGHDCSVAVGAPLKSGAGGAATTQPMIQPTTAAPAISLPANNTTGNTSGAKLNPPHGQPGHDCSVEVGKPLKQ